MTDVTGLTDMTDRSFGRATRALLMSLLPLLTSHGAAQAQTHSHAQAHAHQHGAITLSIGIEAVLLTVQLEAPLDSLVGFEHAPRTAAQKQTAQTLLARLRTPANLFRPDAAAGCTPGEFEIEPGVLDAGAPASSDGHADLEATWTWTCTNPLALRSLDLDGLMKAAPRIARVSAQVASPQGQFKASLKRPTTVLRWGR
jgi:hypothetical protein